MTIFDNKVVLVTGGTGSFGKRFVYELLHKYPKVKKIIVFSRDELKQFEMSNREAFRNEHDKLRYFIGDIRDFKRLRSAFSGVDYVVHAAALKQVPTAEYNPFECIKTNILGAQNIIEAAFANSVERVVALSTDKAVSPVNLYGATKLCSDKLFTAANNIKGDKNIGFSVVRYGNVFGSRGSVVPFFLDQAKKGILPITDEGMTRFNITLDEGVDLVVHALTHAKGGEVFIPKIPSYRILDLAQAIGPECEKKTVGIRPGEKLHEEMVSMADSFTAYDFQKYFVIYSHAFVDALPVIDGVQGRKVPEGFRYASDQNDQWMTVDDIKALLEATYIPKTN